MRDWQYEPASDVDKGLVERLKGFPREPHIWVYLLRSVTALLLRTWLKAFHRLEIHGRSNLPIGRSFILVANHQSHLDALCLSAAIPLGSLHRTFPAAAADYFFRSIPRSAFAAIVINAFPFARDRKGAASLEVCRELLRTTGNILILFPEGTRSTTGVVAPFLAGIGRLAEGSEIPVVPCHLQGSFEAFPKGAILPRPRKLVLRIGEPRSYGELPRERRSVKHICEDLREAVVSLGSEISQDGQDEED